MTISVSGSLDEQGVHAGEKQQTKPGKSGQGFILEYSTALFSPFPPSGSPTRLIAEVDENAGIVLADRVQLLQVLLNLTMNAFEALTVIRADARRVVTRVEPVQDGKICVSVRDTGPGFPDGIVDQLFEAFFSTKAEGTGMGLAIARSIIEAHGGTLSGENCAKGGALFTICLPEAIEGKSKAA